DDDGVTPKQLRRGERVEDAVGPHLQRLFHVERDRRRERPSTTTGRTVVARSTASHNPCVTGGTTDATTAARTSWVDRPSCARYDVSVAAQSSGGREGVVGSRQWAWRLSPRNSVTFVSVLLMLMAKRMMLS